MIEPKRSAFLGLSLCAMTPWAHQDPPVMHIESSRPSVYLSFERIGPRKPRFRTEQGEGIWLRLHNNTATHIFLYANAPRGSTTQENEGGPILLKDSMEVEACYDVDGVPDQKASSTGKEVKLEVPFRVAAPAQSPFTSCNWRIVPTRRLRKLALEPGKSVLLSVPRNFLKRGLRISTEFSYAWEARDGYVEELEPTHLVYFSYFQLPSTPAATGVGRVAQP